MIGWQVETITCPQGIRRPIPSRLQADSDSHVTIHFPKATGQAGPLQEQCISGDRGRTISLDGDDPARQAERERQQEETWQTHDRERSRVKDTVHRVVAHERRRSRYSS